MSATKPEPFASRMINKLVNCSERVQLLEDTLRLVLNNGYRHSSTNQDDGDKLIERKMLAALQLSKN